MKKYLDLPYILIILSVISIIREIVKLDYSNLSFGSLVERLFSSGLLILFMIYVIRRNNKNSSK